MLLKGLTPIKTSKQMLYKFLYREKLALGGGGGGGNSHVKRGGMLVKPLKETILGVAQAFFDPQKRPY